MKSNMNDARKVMLGNANNPIPDIITSDLIEEAWNYSALSKVIRFLGKLQLYPSISIDLLISSTDNLVIITHITDIGTELKMSFNVQATFNRNAGEKELGEVLLGLPYPPCPRINQKFKVILIPKSVIAMVDRMPTQELGMNIALIDSTHEFREKEKLGFDMKNVKKIWNAIKKIKIRAGDAIRYPYRHEEQKFRPHDYFLDAQVEKFLEEFVIDKQMALHLGRK